VQVISDGPHYHLTRVEAHPDLNLDPLGPTQLFSVTADPLLHAKRGTAGTNRGILMGQRCAEEGHDPISHDPVHRALVAVDRLHHPFDNRIEDLPCFLRVTIGKRLHRSPEIGKEYGDLLAFPFEGTPGSKDLFRQIFGSIGFGRPVGAGRDCFGLG
jgi:hypothetical protein